MDTTLESSRIKIDSCICNTFQSDIRSDIYKGLTSSQKYIPSKYLYDSRGSQLFELICDQPEYYQTRTELSILKDAAPVIMRDFGNGHLIELGSGSNLKVRTLLDSAWGRDICYMPIDVSGSAIFESCRELLMLYPELKVHATIADFTRHLHGFPEGRKIFLFFGSTIGNFDQKERACLLNSISYHMRPEDRFLLGIDMIKPKEILESAYNDSAGVTADFNKNVLHVINRELNAGFNIDHFDHLAFFNEEKERIEMHLKANRKLSVDVRKLDLNVTIEKDETIHTEICAKFSRENVYAMARQAGLIIERWFTDPLGWFSLIELAAEQ